MRLQDGLQDAGHAQMPRRPLWAPKMPDMPKSRPPSSRPRRCQRRKMDFKMPDMPKMPEAPAFEAPKLPDMPTSSRPPSSRPLRLSCPRWRCPSLTFRAPGHPQAPRGPQARLPGPAAPRVVPAPAPAPVPAAPKVEMPAYRPPPPAVRQELPRTAQRAPPPPLAAKKASKRGALPLWAAEIVLLAGSAGATVAAIKFGDNISRERL